MIVFRSGATAALLLPIIEDFKNLQLWVVGDLILDEYVVGPVERISPEAPVPIVRVRETEYRLGGAANVARQIAALGARVVLAGLVGADSDGERILDLCRQANVDTSAVLKIPGRRTTRKLRVLAGHQQLMRLDWEDTEPAEAAVTEALLSGLRRNPQPAAIILSDYAKGVLTPATLDALAHLRSGFNCPMVVDPKHQDFMRYRGATHLTPNLRELEVAINRTFDPASAAAVALAARVLSQELGLEGMVVTLGERGMLVVPREGTDETISGTSRAVFDVTGAGDTAIAVLTLALAAKASLASAAQLANAAAGVSVEQVGTAAVGPSRLREALSEHTSGKLLNAEELVAKATSWRLRNQRVVFTNGCFDLLHAGHLSLLQHAARLGDKLVVAINSDASVRRLKGPSRPLVPDYERAAILGALTYVDAVIIYDEDTPLRTLERVLPQVLVKGGDYRVEDVVGRELVESIGGRVVLVPVTPEHSTSSLVERIVKTRNVS